MTKRRAFYPFGGKKARLPRNPKTYLDCLSSEASEVDTQTKRLEIGYAITHGLNFEKEVKDYVKQHKPIVDERIMKMGLVHYISYMRSGDEIDDITDYLEELLTLPDAIELFKQELLLRFELLKDGELDDDDIIYSLNVIHMDYDAIANEVDGDKEKFNYILTHSTEVK